MHLHSLLLLSQPSRLPVTVTKPCRIYIFVTFHVHQHQTCNSHYSPQLVEIERKQCLKKTYTSVKSYLPKQNKKKIVLSDWDLQYSRRPELSLASTAGQPLDWRVFLTPTELLYRITAFGKRKHARWKWLQLLTCNYISLKTSASFLAHVLQAIWHFALCWHLVLRSIRRERPFYDRAETRCL